jgi:hypothetical protein
LLEPNFVALFEELSAAKIPSFCALIYNNLFGEFPIRTVLDSKSGKKPVLTDSSTNGCRCQLQEVPQSHAEMPIFGFQIARWELFGKISACFHLLFLPCGLLLIQSPILFTSCLRVSAIIICSLLPSCVLYCKFGALLPVSKGIEFLRV